jgi:trk system potassium uptake protein TrkA
VRILIAGGGEVGSLIARRLIREGNEVCIVDEDAERCAILEDTLDASVFRGSAASYNTMKKAGLGSADMLIAVTSHDEINLLACMIAQADFDVRVKVARMRTHEVDSWRRIAHKSGVHIDLIIHPESEAAARILPVLRMPGVTEILDFAGGRVKLFGMNIEAGSWVAGKTLIDLDRASPPKHSLIAMIFRSGQVIIPHGNELLLPDDQVYVITRQQDMENVIKFMGLPGQSWLDRAFVLGGKQLGILVAEELERSKVRVKLFERDGSRCRKISELLKNTVVVHGDGTDALTLSEENIQDVGAYLALTNDDEDNLIAALLAKRLGARKVVALINRANYLPMAQRLGIHTAISPRLVTVDRILQFVRKGRVLSVTTFGEEAAEALELVASPDSRYIGRKLKEVRLPREVVVGAIMRPGGEVVVPRGEDSINAGDRVIFFALEGSIINLEKAFLAEDRSRHQ